MNLSFFSKDFPARVFFGYFPTASSSSTLRVWFTVELLKVAFDVQMCNKLKQSVKCANKNKNELKVPVVVRVR